MQTFQHAIGQLHHRQQLLAILVFSLVAIMVWIGVSLISSQRKTAISPELRKMAEPLTPNINQTSLDAIDDRKYLPAEELTDFPIFSIPDSKRAVRPPASPTPAATPPNESTPAPSETPLSTPSPAPDASASASPVP